MDETRMTLAATKKAFDNDFLDMSDQLRQFRIRYETMFALIRELRKKAGLEEWPVGLADDYNNILLAIYTHPINVVYHSALDLYREQIGEIDNHVEYSTNT